VKESALILMQTVPTHIDVSQLKTRILEKVKLFSSLVVSQLKKDLRGKFGYAVSIVYDYVYCCVAVLVGRITGFAYPSVCLSIRLFVHPSVRPVGGS